MAANNSFNSDWLFRYRTKTSSDIRWSEMYAALDNGGYCKDCAKAHQEVLKKKATKNKKSKKTRRK